MKHLYHPHLEEWIITMITLSLLLILMENSGFSYSDSTASQSAILTEAEAWSELVPHLYLLL